jgi:hypothetical protein
MSDSAAAPKPPSARSLLLLQSHIVSGVLAKHHIQALAADDQSLLQLHALVDCVRAHQNFVATAPPEKQRSAQSRNLLCVCKAVCPDETAAWVQCYRTVMAARRTSKTQPAHSESMPKTNCEDLRRNLEACTQYASTRLLHAAILPPDRQDVVL